MKRASLPLVSAVLAERIYIGPHDKGVKFITRSRKMALSMV
jgi:hypothetical protein